MVRRAVDAGSRTNYNETCYIVKGGVGDTYQKGLNIRLENNYNVMKTAARTNFPHFLSVGQVERGSDLGWLRKWRSRDRQDRVLGSSSLCLMAAL